MLLCCFSGNLFYNTAVDNINIQIQLVHLVCLTDFHCGVLQGDFSGSIIFEYSAAFSLLFFFSILKLFRSEVKI